MALQQPTRQPVQRTAAPAAVGEESVAVVPSISEQAPEESQAWVLFSAPTETTATSYLTESEHSPETPGRSRLSDVGSLHTVARSEASPVARQPISVFSAIDDQSVDDDAELDSLDSHLPEFRSVPGLNTPSPRGGQQSAPIFPSHDGLGSFHLGRPVLGAEAQDQIYQFEKFNPRKARRRLDSFEDNRIKQDKVQTEQDEKRQRIEAWRLEHSRVLLDEIQRETKRQRKSLASTHRSRRTADAETDNLTWHDEDAFQPHTEQEGFLARITRTVVKDILGIDDNMLSILLGEQLPDDGEKALSTAPQASQLSSLPILTTTDEPSWQIRILERLSRELGLLVNQLSTHPGAFSTYSRLQHSALPYAGLPVIPECSDVTTGPATEAEKASQAPFPDFQPTMHQRPQPIGIPSRRQTTDGSGNGVDATDTDFTKEEWERSLDIKLVFRYLVSRFASRSGNSPTAGNTSHHGAQTQQDTAAKVARVRQHHPLIARTRQLERRSFKAVAPNSPVMLRHHSSCASQSTRRSARRSSCSSRHYWDLGGSLGTGSVIASNGPMGSWGEV
ncbi:uncharacterized protein MAM_05570 [Metarhizium album ARSEF 1941]|uniref:Uncharacterized protein n=1 Tax=Metarhizium album (strain ARSEF 1941) TaxID=1081103 RepID=A0A0B2WT06_METAS|nr:uncharacterized protein MAM_05570 [Metarhizium album ARSEF 1941]KHN96627.1 hypothetical protein MAM_05570 [Metarhizium album ARSEF 1941]